MNEASEAPHAIAPASSTEALTADRAETKYLVSPTSLDSLVAELSSRLSSHRFTGDGANRLSDAHHFVTTVYYDTPEHDHLRAARRDPERNVKIRAKEYYDLHPSLAELATDPADIVRYSPWLWLEIKRRDGLRTRKDRVRLLKRDVPRFLADPTADPGWLAGSSRDHGAEVWSAELRGRHLSACCLVNYRRLSWQDDADVLRVTIDVGLACYAPPEDLWTREQPLIRGAFGAPRGTEPNVVVEVKSRGSTPAWQTGVLDGIDAQQSQFSKFVAAAHVVLGQV
jgi:hypothetical protein